MSQSGFVVQCALNFKAPVYANHKNKQMNHATLLYYLHQCTYLVAYDLVPVLMQSFIMPPWEDCGGCDDR